ncbi:MAG: hypothetical protein AAFO82_09210, partial [Bacteroidota bacterium]
MRQEIKEVYLNRSAQYQQEAEQLQQKYNRFSIIRLLIFFAALAIIILLWSSAILLGVLGIIVFLVGFYRFVIWHQAIKTEELHLRQLSEINANEVKVLEHDYSMFEDGEEFLNPLHSYSLDLDIFGDHSFFQYCNRTNTVIGKQALANMLQEEVNLEAIQERQQAIQELGKLLDWRQDLQAYGANTKDAQEHLDLLEYWLDQPNFVLQNRLYKAAFYFAPVLTMVAIGLAIDFPWWLAILPIIPNLLIIRRTVQKVTETHQQTTHADKALSHYAALIQHIENQSFQTSLLNNLSAAFVDFLSTGLKAHGYSVLVA